MLQTYSGSYSVVLGNFIQYLSGEGTFHGRESPRVDILNSNAGGRWAVLVGARPPPTGLMRTPHTPGGYQPHAKGLFFYFVSYKKVGLFISFSGS